MWLQGQIQVNQNRRIISPKANEGRQRPVTSQERSIAPKRLPSLSKNIPEVRSGGDANRTILTKPISSIRPKYKTMQAQQNINEIKL